MRGVKKLLIVTAAVLVLSGCGAREEQLSETPAAPGVENTPIDNEATPEENDIEEQPEETQPENSGETTEPPASGEEEVDAVSEERLIKVYRTDDQLMELVEAEEVITFTDEQEMLEAALDRLQQDGDEGTISLWKEIQFKDVSVADGNVVLDLSVPGEARMGSGGEAFAVESITSTVFQFEAFDTLQLLVDGEQVESLMGHVTLEHPFVK
ncbi:GerMN domain-containing protein [Paenibacillus sp. 1P07SE]|uniref:GerMN domain-containing protein n=1 Tax=Paenibacillus sp. 1P07SE TaxID=3132209 RepID=UPI0039A57554